MSNMDVQVKSITQEQFDAFVDGLKYPPNKFQRAILNSIAFESGNLMVNALAGSGKTSLLVMTADLFHIMGIRDVMYLAFNVSIRDELNERLPHGYTAINSHSLGMQLLKAHLNSKTRLGKFKMNDLAKDVLSAQAGVPLSNWELYAFARKLEGIASKVMLNDVDPHDLDAVVATAEFFGYGADEEDDRTPAIDLVDLCKMIPSLLQSSWDRYRATGEVTFDEMLYFAVKHIDAKFYQKYEWILVDECQDLNVLQQQIAIRSCAEGGRMLFVGDKRQAIYLFAGADARSFDNIISSTNAKVLPLNTCYRCPTSHLKLAQSLVPQIEPRDNAPEGLVKYIKNDDLPSVCEPGTMILSRTKAPLLSTYFDLLAARKPAVVLGRDIGKELTKTLTDVSKMPMFTYGKVGEFLDQYKAQKVAQLAQRESNDEKIQNLTDKIEAIAICAESFTDCHNIDDLKKAMESLFIDPEEAMKGRAKGIILCTVHKAKGLEADNVVILNIDKMPLRFPKQKPQELEQEMNIKYVALTRGKKNLYIITGDGEPVSVATTEAKTEDEPVLYTAKEFFADKEEVDCAHGKHDWTWDKDPNVTFCIHCGVIEDDETEEQQETAEIVAIEAQVEALQEISVGEDESGFYDSLDTIEEAPATEPVGEIQQITGDKSDNTMVIAGVEENIEPKSPVLSVIRPGPVHTGEGHKIIGIDHLKPKREQVTKLLDNLNEQQIDALITMIKAFAS